MLRWTDVLFGIVYQALFIAIFMLRIGYGILSKPSSKYPFPEEEFERGGYAKRIRSLYKTADNSTKLQPAGKKKPRKPL